MSRNRTTKGLNDWPKAALRDQWGTMQKVLSSSSRMERVVEDIVFDFAVKPRLISHRGNAMLVASSIYEACRYFELFGKTMFKGPSSVITSYNPNAQDVKIDVLGGDLTSRVLPRLCYDRLNAEHHTLPGGASANGPRPRDLPQ